MPSRLAWLLLSTGLAEDRKRIARHLQAVEADLRARDVSHLTPECQAARAQHLDRLNAYWRAGQFPRNHEFPDRRVPCFVDRDGQACAVAHLLVCGGQQQLVDNVARSANHALVADIHAPEFEEWMTVSGFTRSELGRIQPEYGGEQELAQIIGYSKAFSNCLILALVATAGNLVQFLRGFGRSWWLIVLLAACAGMTSAVQHIADLSAIVRRLQPGANVLGPYWDLQWQHPYDWLNYIPAGQGIVLTLVIINSPGLFLSRRADKADVPVTYRLAAIFMACVAALMLWLPDIYELLEWPSRPIR